VAAPLEHPPAAQAELDLWLESIRGEKRPATVDGYRIEVAKLLAAFPDTRFVDFTQQQIEQYLGGVNEKYRGKSASYIRGWFKWGEKTGRIVDVRNPMRFIEGFKWLRSGPVRDRFTDAEQARLKGLPHPDGVMMEILLETGIKTGEARALTGKCWEFEVPQLRITESPHPRVIPLPDKPFVDRVARMLQIEGIGPHDFVWYTHRGGSRERKHDRQPSAGPVQQWWTSGLKAAKVPHRMMRTTRNTYARRMQDQGVPLSDLSLWMGHNDAYTTSEYYAEDRRPEARRRYSSLKEATEVIQAQRELLRRALPHLLTPGAPGAVELATEIAGDLAE
jgi:integrase